MQVENLSTEKVTVTQLKPEQTYVVTTPTWGIIPT